MTWFVKMSEGFVCFGIVRVSVRIHDFVQKSKITLQLYRISSWLLLESCSTHQYQPCDVCEICHSGHISDLWIRTKGKKVHILCKKHIIWGTVQYCISFFWVKKLHWRKCLWTTAQTPQYLTNICSISLIFESVSYNDHDSEIKNRKKVQSVGFKWTRPVRGKRNTKRRKPLRATGHAGGRDWALGRPTIGHLHLGKL